MEWLESKKSSFSIFTVLKRFKKKKKNNNNKKKKNISKPPKFVSQSLLK